MLDYKIALINVGWSINDNYNRYFTSLEEQKTYFDNKGASYLAPFSNFNMGDNVITNITFTDNTSRPIEEVIACNYAIVSNNGDYRYFFARVMQKSGRTFFVDLELDDIQSNYFRYKDDIKNGVIKRAHLGRFEGNSFKVGEGSPFLTNNYILNQRITNKSKVKMKYFEDTILNDWINENVLYWCYVYISSEKDYTLKDREGTKKSYTANDFKFNNGKDVALDYSVICYPVLKDNAFMALEYNTNIPEAIDFINLGYEGLKGFRDNNNDSSFFYTIKYSTIPPINYSFRSYRIIEASGSKQLYLQYTTTGTGGAYFNYTNFAVGLTEVSAVENVGLFININQNTLTYESEEITINYNNTFTDNQIKSSIGESISPYNESFGVKRFRVRTQLSEGFEYDYLKYNDNIIKLLYTEMLTPDITKSYIRIKSNGNIYTLASESSGIGDLSSEDNSFIYDSSKLGEFLANNKNFYLQTAFKLGTDVVKGVGAGAVSGGPVGAVVGGGTALIGGAVNTYFQIDNLKASPNSLANAKGNIIFNNAVNDLGIYIEEFEALEIDKLIMLDLINEIGYNIELTGQPKDYDNIRVNHNHLECDYLTIIAPISNREKDRLKAKLLNITFYNNDLFDTNRPNYERSFN